MTVIVDLTDLIRRVGRRAIDLTVEATGAEFDEEARTAIMERVAAELFEEPPGLEVTTGE